MLATEDLAAQLKIDEGSELQIYTDTADKITVGVGRNLTDCGIYQDESDLMLSNDINKKVYGPLDAQLPWWRDMDDVRQGVIANMCFNLGIWTLLKFTSTLTAMKSGDYSNAAKFMRASKWHTEVTKRAERLAVEMETGIKQ